MSVYLLMVLAIPSTSSAVGGFSDPAANTKLMGSKSRDSDRDRYAFSNTANDKRNAFSGLKTNIGSFLFGVTNALCYFSNIHHINSNECSNILQTSSI